ncbi:YqfQ-like protein [Ureibacillus xyleni]|uniref:YqfQ-like protein n=1 Tax=Ureibacillus xyleni TaxID=614648 RepID=A0A285TF90_9BACL|nr:VrrA/YqfQ family protein [Ureibacillus xyleni]SOC20934.1 YqfQ-like protein [Ureibacillus xyleni]
MRPSSFNHNMPRGHNFPPFPRQGPAPMPRGPMPNFGYRPPGHFQPGMMPPPGFQPRSGPGFQQGFQQGPQQPPSQSPKLDSFMNTANKWLATAQSFQPLIQQATPMLQNLPALWKLYKGFQSTPKNTEEEIFDDELDDEPYYEPEPEKPKRRRERPSQRVRSEQTEQKHKPKPKPITSQPSMPRIFQPPYHFD